MQKLKVYIAGKVSPNSVFGRHDWRAGFCAKLSEFSGLEIVNLDPTQSDENFNLDESNAMLVFGRDCFMINAADLVIVNLTDDISVGGSQEMLIAKYFRKPLIGIAPKGGKFNKSETEIRGRVFTDWVHPFVAVPCDAIVEDVEGAAEHLKSFAIKMDEPVKDISILDESMAYYFDNHQKDDKFVNEITV
ncbi:MAG: hypothetical protein PHS79_04065 [Patescibacteria group bacterium]|nr:hypothetical protein [Patescibacteria group bacterium]